MKLLGVVAMVLIALAGPASADPEEARTKLLALPHADVARLIGLWQVKEMEPIKMIYEFRPTSMAMHGENAQGGKSFELTLDADYRLAGNNAIWVIGTHPRPVEDGIDADSPSIMGVEFTDSGEAMLSVSAGEKFTLVKVPASR
ncbi:MAG TPA: hypothetical protein VL899_15155 [Alphaproteobacteria bacterium]|jgi:hypothetical protein|nr:hypothetical protein [Alphaproteobacteria bacterium]